MCTHTLSHACARAQTHTVSLLRGGSMRVLQCACRGQMTTCRSQFSLCSTWGLRDQVEVIRLVSKSHWPFLAFLNTAFDTQKFYILMRFNLPFLWLLYYFPCFWSTVGESISNSRLHIFPSYSCEIPWSCAWLLFYSVFFKPCVGRSKTSSIFCVWESQALITMPSSL